MNILAISILFSFLTIYSPVLGQNGPSHGKRVVCYMASWGVYLTGKGRFDIRDADPAMPMCTHLVYLFSELDDATNELKVMSGARDIDQSGIAQSVALKIRHPHLKVMTCLGGWNAGSVVFSKMTKTKALRKGFINSTIKFLRTHRLDGLDFNWQFPGDRGGDPADKTNYVTLIKEMREEFDKQGFIISVALSSFPFRIGLGVDGVGLAEHAHFLNVLSYEYHGFWNEKVGANTPMKSNDEYNLEVTYNLYNEMGVPPSQINMGLSAYGVTFTLDEPVTNYSQIIGSHSKNYAFKGPFNDPLGFMAYNEICYENKTNGGKWTEVWDDLSQAPFAVQGNQVISYDNQRSYIIKLKFAIERKLGGIIFYGLEKDDFRGECSPTGSKYPVLQTITKMLLQYGDESFKSLLGLFQRHTADFFWNGMKGGDKDSTFKEPDGSDQDIDIRVKG